MYCIEQRVAYSQVDAGKRLTIPAIIDYFQDCSTFQSEDLGVGLEPLAERGLFWVINSWQLEILRRPALGERVRVYTRPYELRGFLGYRNFYIKDEEGAFLVKGNSLWSLLSTKDFKPVAIPEDIFSAYVLAEKLEMEYAPRKIRPAGERKEKEPFAVSTWHLDPNHHVNNGQYIHIASNFLPEDFEITSLRAEYRKQAFLGDVMVPVVYDGGGSGKQETGEDPGGKQGGCPLLP